MQSAEEILKEKLSKRVLSNKTTREGMLACFIVTLMKYRSLKGIPSPEEEMRIEDDGEAGCELGQPVSILTPAVIARPRRRRTAAASPPRRWGRPRSGTSGGTQPLNISGIRASRCSWVA